MSDYFAEQIVEPGKLALFLMLVAFIVTFLFIRLSVRMIRAEVSWWPGNVQPGGLHIHHVVFGLVFMLIGGVLAFAPIAWQSPWWEITGVLFGIGAALVLDEFALILHLDDVYWSEQGRKSIDVVFLCAALVGMLVLGASPLGVGDVSEAEEAVRYAWLSTLLINGLFVVISLLKGRIWLGVLGLLVPLLALIGTLRLARPGSPWARRRYKEGSRKRERSMQRAARHDTQWRTWKHRVFDAVAGRPDVPPPVLDAPAEESAEQRDDARR
jgi:hypothetical protein